MQYFVRRILDLIAPRPCVMCGERLALTEEFICSACMMTLPLTGCHSQPYDNEMARRLWGRFPLERATALFYFSSHNPSARIIHAMKYGHMSSLCRYMGRLAATEAGSDFFSGIDGLLYVPLTRHRQWERGYNQCQLIASGISSETSIPVLKDVVRRTRFTGSQTQRSITERLSSMQDTFSLRHPERIKGLHVLLIDDVVTSGATIEACAQALLPASPKAISVLTLGLTRH